MKRTFTALVISAFTAMVLIAASAKPAQATCWGCFYTGGSNYECNPTLNFGWRYCTASSNGCLMQTPCAKYFTELTPEGTGRQQESASGDESTPITASPLIEFEPGRKVELSCGGAIVARRYDPDLVAELRLIVKQIQI